MSQRIHHNLNIASNLKTPKTKKKSRTRAITLTISQRVMMNNRSRILRVMKETKMKIAVGRISRRSNLRVKSALTNSATPKRYTKS